MNRIGMKLAPYWQGIGHNIIFISYPIICHISL